MIVSVIGARGMFTVSVTSIDDTPLGLDGTRVLTFPPLESPYADMPMPLPAVSIGPSCEPVTTYCRRAERASVSMQRTDRLPEVWLIETGLPLT